MELDLDMYKEELYLVMEESFNCKVCGNIVKEYEFQDLLSGCDMCDNCFKKAQEEK